MRAIRVHEHGPPSVLRYEEVPDPVAGQGEVVMRIKAAGVNPVECYIRSGAYPANIPLPYIPGNDAAGIVESVGAGVTDWKPGDRVYHMGSGWGLGAYAEMAVYPAARLARFPDNVGFAQAAAVPVPYGTVHRALFDLVHIASGETLLVHGASGGVGVAAVQMGVAAGLTVIGTAGTDRGLELVREQGAHHVLDHRTTDYFAKVKDLTGGRGVDVVLENLANVNLGHDLEMLAMFGRIVVVGARGTAATINPRVLMHKDATIIGMVTPNASDADMKRTHASIYAGLANGSLRPVVGREIPLRDAPLAHEAVLEPGAYGKIVLIP